MIKISTLRFSRLSRGAHQQFCRDVDDLLITFGVEADKLDVAEAYEVFKGSLENHLVPSTQHQASRLTAHIAEKDQLRCELYSGLKLLVDSYLYHHDPQQRERAARVKHILNQKENPRKGSYISQSSNLSSLIIMLKTHCAQELTALGANERLDALDAANSEFNKLFDQRNTEYARQPRVDFKQARKEADAAYQAIVERISALITIKGPAPYADFVAELNGQIHYCRTTLAKHEGRLRARAQKELATVG